MLPIAIIFLALTAVVHGKCVTPPAGMTINGYVFDSYESVANERICAGLCMRSWLCIGFAFHRAQSVCQLKSRSLSGKLEHTNEQSVFGICSKDKSSVTRDQIRDHSFTGMSIKDSKGLALSECQRFCSAFRRAAFFNWVQSQEPAYDQNEFGFKNEMSSEGWADATADSTGYCECIAKMTGFQLVPGSVAGIL